MVTELGNQTLSRQEDQRFPSRYMLLCSLCALSFLCCLVCYRAIACFLLFKTKGSSRVKTVIKSFCCSSPWPIDLESNSFLCFQARPRATPLPGLVGLISFWKWIFLFHSPRAKGLFFCFSWSFSRSFFDFLPVWDFHFKKQRNLLRPLFLIMPYLPRKQPSILMMRMGML